jgi:2'-5' RNA ligase
VAVPLPDPVGTAIATVVEAVRAMPLPDGMRDVRWVRLDGLHLTLRFLGPTPEPRLAPTSGAMAGVAAATPPVAIRLAGAGSFPARGRPRALWVGLDRGSEALADLAHSLDAALVEAGWPAETRPFRAHLTLARCDGLASGPLVARRLAEALGADAIDATVDRLVLYESVTGGGPARYVPLHEAMLAG